MNNRSIRCYRYLSFLNSNRFSWITTTEANAVKWISDEETLMSVGLQFKQYSGQNNCLQTTKNYSFLFCGGVCFACMHVCAVCTSQFHEGFFFSLHNLMWICDEGFGKSLECKFIRCIHYTLVGYKSYANLFLNASNIKFLLYRNSNESSVHWHACW